MKNWLGLGPHKTDNLLHWRDNEDKALKLRVCYDKIIACGFINELEILLKASYDYGYNDSEESHAGAEL